MGPQLPARRRRSSRPSGRRLEAPAQLDHRRHPRARQQARVGPRQLIRFPNLYVSLAATINFIVRSPRQFAEVLGKLLFWCGEDRIIYGSETPIWHPQWALKAFSEFQIPEDLCEGYG